MSSHAAIAFSAIADIAQNFRIPRRFQFMG
jgi:hypothetical protein